MLNSEIFFILPFIIFNSCLENVQRETKLRYIIVDHTKHSRFM